MAKQSAGAQLASMRPVMEKHCENCNKLFKGISTAKYCSNACRQAAKYARNKGKK